jgi:hypothetical protein
MIEEEKKESTSAKDNFELMSKFILFVTSNKFGARIDKLYSQAKLNKEEIARVNKYKDYL